MTECEFDGKTMMLSRDVRDLLEVKAELDVARERLQAGEGGNVTTPEETNATSGAETGRKTLSSPDKSTCGLSNENGNAIVTGSTLSDIAVADPVGAPSDTKRRSSLAERVPTGIPSRGAEVEESHNHIDRNKQRNTLISLNSRSTQLPHAGLMQHATSRLSKMSMYTIPNLPPTVLETEAMVMSSELDNHSVSDRKESDPLASEHTAAGRDSVNRVLTTGLTPRNARLSVNGSTSRNHRNAVNLPSPDL